MTGWLGTVRTVKPGGFELLPEGSRKMGLAVPIAEGYASAATLHEATGLPCLAAFDSGNLLPVARAWRAEHPHRRMVIASDNDHALPLRDPPLPNVGAEKGREAAEAVGAALLVPEFAPDDPGSSDWNDRAQLRW